MATLNPYLNFQGNTEEAFLFYKSVFGGEFACIMRFKDMPEGAKLPPADRDKIMHIGLPIGKDTLLMATDALESMGQRLSPGNNFYLCLSPDSIAETDRLFEALSAEGKVTMPLEKAFWGDYFGMLTDKFGIHWMLSFPLEQENQAGVVMEKEVVQAGA